MAEQSKGDATADAATLGPDSEHDATVGPGRDALAQTGGRTERSPSGQSGVVVRTQPPTAEPTTLAAAVRATLKQRSESAALPAADRYADVREIGRGGMGRVVEARDVLLGRKVAHKHLLADHPALRRRFDVEALVTAQLDHPGIPAVFDVQADREGLPSYTMQLLRGESLAKRLKDARTFEERMRLLPVLVKVAHTLAYAHERGVVHRDVKPDNVMVGNHGEAALLDWGIAKVRGLAEGETDGVQLPETQEVAQTAHGSVLGTPAYMAPEQARGEVAQVDERSDVFALGAMLYHLLAGHAPYRGDKLTDVLHQARQGTPPPIDKAAAFAPEPLRQIAAKAMHPDPAQRYQTAGQFAADVENLQAKAVVQPANKGIERFASAVGYFGLLFCILLAALGWMATPTLREMGIAGPFALVLFFAGIALGGLEWATAGRHHLLPIASALAAATALSGVAGAFVGLLNVYKALGRDDVVGDSLKFRALASMGHYEALGNIPFALALSLLQVMVLAMAWRRVAMAKADETRT